MPEALQRVRQEQAKAEPDIARITDAIASDVSLSAEVLKTVNSPAFGLRQAISSIPNAVMLLGLDQVVNIVSSMALRASMKGLVGIRLERFWDTAGDVAHTASAFARDLTGIPQDVAYTLGLMHDCGIPVLMAHLPEYKAFISAAQRRPNINIVLAERHQYGIDHADLGYRIGRSWNMPELVTDAIRHHHRFDALIDGTVEVSEEVVSLVAILKMAEHVSHAFRAAMFRGVDEDEDFEWQRVGAFVLGYFELSELDFEDWKDRLLSELGQRVEEAVTS